MSEVSQDQPKNKSVAKTDTTKELIKQEITPEKIEEARNVLMTDFLSDENDIREYLELSAKSKQLTPKEKERQGKLILGLMKRYGLKNGLWAKNLSYTDYYNPLGQIRQDIVAEYSCKTSLELMLADRIVASYWRAMKYDMVFNRGLMKEDGSYSYDQLKINFLKEVDKGVELANRQLNASIILLKELKQPKLNVKVTTDNAYIAQNQQVNIAQEKTPSNTTENYQNENNDPK